MGSLTEVGFAAAGATHLGRVREGNEDAFFVSGHRGVAIVSDGMGGAPAGDVASQLAVDYVSASLCAREVPEWRGNNWDAAGGILADAIESAHVQIRRHAENHPEHQGLGATVTALIADAEEGRFAVGHVGDSRAYRLRHGVFTQLTRDDTLLQEHLDEGRISEGAADRHPFGHILSQVLGMDHGVSPQVVEGEVAPGDQFFVCSDGVTAVLNDREIGEMLIRGRLWPPETVVNAFIEAVNDRGGPDNATAVLLRRT